VTYQIGDRVKIRGGLYEDDEGEILSAHTTLYDTYRVRVENPFNREVTERWFPARRLSPVAKKSDAVNRPSHYTWLPKGFEVIDMTELLNFNRGNVVKYVARAGRKDKAAEIQDLEKAFFYLKREIARMKGSVNA
jgi:hypothetical protein